MSRARSVHDHVAAGILDHAARLLAERPTASMVELATVAGVGRATIYRYFPSRDALRAALAETAISELQASLADARLTRVPVVEAIARVTRAVLSAADKYRALAHFGEKPDDTAGIDQQLGRPIRALLRRGAADGTLRTDLHVDTLFEVYVALLGGAITRSTQDRLGVEDASAAITAIFLTGAERQRSATRHR